MHAHTVYVHARDTVVHLVEERKVKRATSRVHVHDVHLNSQIKHILINKREEAHKDRKLQSSRMYRHASDTAPAMPSK